MGSRYGVEISWDEKRKKESVIKNIIVVNDYDYVQGGASLVAIEMANLLFDKGFNVVFFCGVSKGGFLNSGIRVVSTDQSDALNDKNRLRGLFKGIRNRHSQKAFRLLLSEFKNTETVIFVHGWTKCLSPSFVVPAKKMGFKMVLTSHDYFSICQNGGLFNYKKTCICSKKGLSCVLCNCDSRNYLYKIYRNIRMFYQKRIVHFCNAFDTLITISDLNEEVLAPFFKTSKIIRIYNPTSISEQNERSRAEESSYYIFVGRICKEKGLDIMLRQINSSKYHIKVVGDGDLLPFLSQKYGSSVEFLGWKNHDETIELIKKSKALLFPSVWYEGAPLTIFEALSMGIPCIVSNICSAASFVDSGNGWLFDPFKTGELESILDSISSENIKQKSEEAYKRFWSDPFSKTRYCNQIISLIKRMEEIA